MAAQSPYDVVWRVLPDPLRPLRLPALFAAATAFVSLAYLLQAAFAHWGASELSPTHLALGLLLIVCIGVVLVHNLAARESRVSLLFWGCAGTMFAGVLFLELTEAISTSPASIGVAVPGSAILALTGILMSAMALFLRRPYLLAAMVFSTVFAIDFALKENFEAGSFTLHIFSLQFEHALLYLTLIVSAELFLIAAYLERGNSGAAVDARTISRTGSLARYIHGNGIIKTAAKWPPARVAYYPVFNELAFLVTMLALLASAGRVVKRAGGPGLASQALQMSRLWFGEGIEPPSYYQLELYRAERRRDAKDWLTRYETKNGLLANLNKSRPNPAGLNEMNDKDVLAEFCRKEGLSHAAVLAVVKPDAIVFPEVPVAGDTLRRDLFLKPRNGLGAHHTLAFRFDCATGAYSGAGVQQASFDEVAAMARAESSGKDMLVQPWLRNHPEIADLAKDSLLTFRVITALDERSEPEVVGAMLRLLSKLEPDWQHLPDGEYAAAIDLESGVLGEFLGDDCRTAPVHMARHPVTGSPILGRRVDNWPVVRDLALKVHGKLRHRVIVGWDIALTPDGAVLLEGNQNFDVMFLQRVLQVPAGKTRFGALLSHHLRRIFLGIE